MRAARGKHRQVLATAVLPRHLADAAIDDLGKSWSIYFKKRGAVSKYEAALPEPLVLAIRAALGTSHERYLFFTRWPRHGREMWAAETKAKAFALVDAGQLNYTQIAAAAGCGRATLWRWLRERG